MKVAIFSKTISSASKQIIETFEENKVPISAVIIETAFRKKFSKREIFYRNAHKKFYEQAKTFSFAKSIIKSGWNKIPLKMKAYMYENIYDFPVLRKKSLQYFCNQKGIEFFEVKKHSSNETRKIIIDNQFNYILLGATSWLLKENILDIPNNKIINAHGGYLPKYRGLDCTAHSMKAGDPIGITTHFVDKGIDTGSILDFYPATIEKGDDMNAVIDKILALRPIALLKTIIALKDSSLQSKVQTETYPLLEPMTYEELVEVNKAFRESISMTYKK